MSTLPVTPPELPTPASALLGGLTYCVPLDAIVRAGTVRTASSGRRVPAALDEFTVCHQHRDSSGEWVRHPLDEVYRKREDCVQGGHDGKPRLRRLPVFLAFDDPSLTMTEEFAAFSTDQKSAGRPRCVGNGSSAKRIDYTSGVTESVPCPGPDRCEFGREHHCDALMRLVVRLEGQDEFGGLTMIRSGSYNAVSECRAVLNSMYRLLGGRCAGLPMWLELRPKASSQSYHSTFWYASLRPRLAGQSLAQWLGEQPQQDVLNRASYEAELRTLRQNGVFGDDPDALSTMEDLLLGRTLDPSEVDQAPAQAEVGGAAWLTTLRSTFPTPEGAAAGGAGADAPANGQPTVPPEPAKATS